MSAVGRWLRWLGASDTRIAVGVGFAVLGLLLATTDMGFVRDEGYYFRAARQYHGWFGQFWSDLLAGQPWHSFERANIDRYFGYNTEHPGLIKLTMGWTWRIFHKGLGWMSASTALRLGSMIFVALGFAATYLLGAKMFSRRVGFIAVGLLASMPHVFYHSHLACFDGPIMGLQIAATYAFWRSLSYPRWVVPAGVVWGMALATKHNAVFLLPTLLLSFWAARPRDVRLSQNRLSIPPLPAAVVAMVLIGPCILLLTYPFGWPAPLERLGAYYGYHASHEHYPVDFFGTLFTEPPFPWSFPFTMSGLTIPLPSLVLGFAGLVALGKVALGGWLKSGPQGSMQNAWFIVLGALVPFVVIAHPSVPIFGGTKHWMTAMPFLSLAGAWAACRSVEELRSHGRLAWVPVCLVLAWGTAETARTHPLQHTYFNSLAGGHIGGARLGMPRTFWGGDGLELLDELNAAAGPGATVFTDRMNFDSFRAYQEEGLLREDLRYAADLRGATWALINHQREYAAHERAAWAAMGGRLPYRRVGFDGVPIVSLYRLYP